MNDELCVVRFPALIEGKLVWVETKIPLTIMLKAMEEAAKDD